MKSILRYILIFIIVSFLSFLSCYEGDSDNNTSTSTSYQYHTYEEIEIFLDEIVSAYPQIATIETVGYSELGRVIRALIISDKSELAGKPAIRLTGGIHGNEMMSIELLIRFIEYLTSNYEDNSKVRNIVDKSYICIIPVLNPDGLVRNRRYNDNNIDLNRNFNASGDDLQSETKFLQDYSADKCFVLSITYHVGQVLVNIPFDFGRESMGDFPVENDLVRFYAETYSKAGTFLENPDLYESDYMEDGVINGGDWYVIYGSLQDWSYQKTGCIDLTIEVANRNPNSESGVEQVFLYNRDSLMEFIDKADQGIYGRVTDSTGNPISDVEITTSWSSISGDITGDIVIKTDREGYYNRILLPGTYNLTFTKSGYTTKTENDIKVTYRIKKDVKL
ncbi:MAG: M14 family carboxypeptidase N/E [Leptospirales bacterium]|nr:M14 family carboxypeptidase N/E [Leptospirales bacterium]